MTRRNANKLIALGASSLFTKPNSIFAAKTHMDKRTIPSSNEKIAVIGLGTWQTFDVGSSSQEREPLKEVLSILTKYGGSVIDSSPMYGRSEKVVGELTTELNLNGSIFEATKVWTSGLNEGISQINNSIKLLEARPLDLLQIHNLLDWKTHLSTLRKLKEKGEIRYLGITHYHEGGYSEMEKIMKSEVIDFIQINYNLAARGANKRLLPLAQDNGIGVLINRPFEGGTLFRKFKGKGLPEWAAEFNAESWGQLFLKFILANEAVTCVIPGTSKPKHMEDNTQAGFGVLPSIEHKKRMIELISSV